VSGFPIGGSGNGTMIGSVWLSTPARGALSLDSASFFWLLGWLDIVILIGIFFARRVYMMWRRNGNTKSSSDTDLPSAQRPPTLNSDHFHTPSEHSNSDTGDGVRHTERIDGRLQETPQTNVERGDNSAHDNFITPLSTEAKSAVSHLSPDGRNGSTLSMATPKSTGSTNERGLLFHNHPKPTSEPTFLSDNPERHRIAPTPRISSILPISPASAVSDFSVQDIPDAVMQFIKSRYQEVDREVVDELIDALSQPPTPRTAAAATNIASAIAKGSSSSIPKPQPDVPSTPISPNMGSAQHTPQQRHLPTVLEDIADVPPVPVTPEKPSIPPLPLDMSGLSTPQSQPPRPPRGNEYFPDVPLVESRGIEQPVMMSPVMLAPVMRSPSLMDPQGMMMDSYDPSTRP